MPSFLIDPNTDEVSQTGCQETSVFHCFGTVLALFVPPIQANTTRVIGQNSVKYRPTAAITGSPLQLADELHQKDLRINLKYCHILGPETEADLRADMFLALSLIVPFNVPRDPYTDRRVDIPVKRPCELLD